MIKKCNNCKFKNDEKEKICVKCGYILNDDIVWNITSKQFLFVLAIIYLGLIVLYFGLNIFLIKANKTTIRIISINDSSFTFQ